MAHRTLTRQQAASRAEELLRAAAHAADPGLSLDYDPSIGNNVTGCQADVSDASKMVTVDRAAWLQGASSGDQVKLATSILNYWKQKGFTIGGSSGFDVGKPQIDQVQTHDAFYLSLTTAGNGRVSIGATSPCIFPDGRAPSS